MTERSKIEYTLLPLGVSVLAARWFGSKATEAVRTTTTRFLDNQRVARHIQTLRYIHAEVVRVQEVEERGAEFAYDLELVDSSALSLLDTMIKKDPAAPVEQHIIGVASILAEKTKASPKTVRVAVAKMCQSTGGEFPYMMTDEADLTQNPDNPI